MIAEGHVEPPEDRRRTAVTFVAPGYFQTLGIRRIAGHDFTFHDVGRHRVAIINQAMARRYFAGINPIGKHVTIDRDRNTGWIGSDQPYEIVGLVGDVKAIELRDAPYPTMYFNMFQENQLMDQFELRTTVNPASVSGTVRRIVQDVLKTAPVTRVITLADQVDSNIVPERLMATLAQFFGVLGAALAGIGLYGLLAYSVARRTNEVGIRMALGATASDVSSLVLRDALGMVCGGLAAGGWVIIAVALLAAYVPMRRAVRVDPMVALRHD
jgi:hypothetical protein